MMIERNTKIRIANPSVTQVQLDLSLLGRKLIPMSKLRQAIVLKETDSDWTTIGVIYYKATQKSKNGNTFTIWKMTDLLGDIITVTVLLFGRANAKHYSMPINKVVGLLNPKVLEDRTGKGELSISVDHPDKIMEMGDSIGNVQLFVNLILILHARWRFKIVCLQTKLASLAIHKKSNFNFQ